jgi:hypothetical protein
VTATVDCKTAPDCKPTPTLTNYCETSTAPSAQVNVTVARRQAFIVLGTGSEITISGTKYQHPYSALVTDINGNPIKGAIVDLTVIPTRYGRGWWEWSDKVDPAAWVKIETMSCINEDLNRNAILDAGEDINRNGQLDPRNVAVLADASGTGTGSSIKITTDANGFADFNIFYLRNYATWTEVELIARTVVAGTEAEARENVRLKASALDFATIDSSPPPADNFYGIGATHFNTTLNKWVIDERDSRVGDFNKNNVVDENIPATCESPLEIH